MRIVFNNQIDALSPSEITPLTETTLYEATQVRDQRLTTQWWTTSPTSQTITFNAGGTVTEGETRQPMFQATTNLIVDPENMTSGNWTETGDSITTAGTNIVGIPAYTHTNDGGSNGFVYQNITGGWDEAAICVGGICRSGTSGTGRILAFNISTATVIGRADINFTTRSIAAAENGTIAIEEWIDDDTVRVYMKTAAVDGAANAVQFRYYPGTGSGTALTSIWSAPQAVDNAYPLAYTATTRSAWNDATAASVAYAMPPSGKYIVDCEFFPYFNYDISAKSPRMWEFFASAQDRVSLRYAQAGDALQLISEQNDVASIITSGLVFDGGTAATINQTIRAVSSIDISESGAVTGSRLIVMPRTQGSFNEATTWSQGITLPDVALPTLFLGVENTTDHLDGFMSHLRIYGGTLDTTITTEAELDAELKTKTETYEYAPQEKFDVNTLGILGHNISPEADITVALNDFDEWNYSDGSGSNIVQNTMTWNEDNILTFLSSVTKRQYAKFTINDPNNDDAQIKIGRIWVGDYMTIDPSSLLDFTVTKKNSDRTIYGINRQKWADEGVDWKRVELSFPRMTAKGTTSMVQKMERMIEDVGRRNSVIFCNFDTNRDYTIVEPLYCSMPDDTTFRHTRNQKYGFRIVFEEDK